MGTWKATGLTSFTPVAGSGESGGRSGGILEIAVQVSTMGSAPQTGTMRIADTGSDTGVTLSIHGGATFVPAGTGTVSINAAGSGGRGSGDGEGGN